MNNKILFIQIVLLSISCSYNENKENQTSISLNQNNNWQINEEKSYGIKKERDVGLIISQNEAFFRSQLIRFEKKQRILSITVKQSDVWNNWKKIPKITPKELVDAPVFVPVKKNEYWLLGRHQRYSKNGYHAWFSSNMIEWEHKGIVTSLANKWVTSAEYYDGRFYIYYDKPNDEDPHLIIDEDLADNKQGKDMGRVFHDPSHGSDIAVFRDEDGLFHIIYEDWSPINPRENHWDSPLAGHTSSKDGITNFSPHKHPPVIDKRTKATGKNIPYEPHPNQLVPAPDNNPYIYEEHIPTQEVFGDYAMIKVGGIYYIFSDYAPVNQSIRLAKFYSRNIYTEFTSAGSIGEGFHPDPTIGFAEDRFWLIIQSRKGVNFDFISNGPWNRKVQIRFGIDTNNDGVTDLWTNYQEIKEIYKQKENFVYIVEKASAMAVVNKEAYGVVVELKVETEDRESKIIIESIEIKYK